MSQVLGRSGAGGEILWDEWKAELFIAFTKYWEVGWKCHRQARWIGKVPQREQQGKEES